MTRFRTVERSPGTVIAIVALVFVALACGAPSRAEPGSLAPATSPGSFAPTSSPTPNERDQAIAVAESEAAGNSATHPVLLDAKREVLNCHPQPCPEVWTVSFAVTDASGKRGQATIEIDAASGKLMYSDWSWR